MSRVILILLVEIESVKTTILKRGKKITEFLIFAEVEKRCYILLVVDVL